MLDLTQYLVEQRTKINMGIEIKAKPISIAGKRHTFEKSHTTEKKAKSEQTPQIELIEHPYSGKLEIQKFKKSETSSDSSSSSIYNANRSKHSPSSGEASESSEDSNLEANIATRRKKRKMHPNKQRDYYYEGNTSKLSDKESSSQTKEPMLKILTHPSHKHKKDLSKTQKSFPMKVDKEESKFIYKEQKVKSKKLDRLPLRQHEFSNANVKELRRDNCRAAFQDAIRDNPDLVLNDDQVLQMASELELELFRLNPKVDQLYTAKFQRMLSCLNKLKPYKHVCKFILKGKLDLAKICKQQDNKIFIQKLNTIEKKIKQKEATAKQTTIKMSPKPAVVSGSGSAGESVSQKQIETEIETTPQKFIPRDRSSTSRITDILTDMDSFNAIAMGAAEKKDQRDEWFKLSAYRLQKFNLPINPSSNPNDPYNPNLPQEKGKSNSSHSSTLKSNSPQHLLFSEDDEPNLNVVSPHKSKTQGKSAVGKEKSGKSQYNLHSKISNLGPRASSATTSSPSVQKNVIVSPLSKSDEVGSMNIPEEYMLSLEKSSYKNLYNLDKNKSYSIAEFKHHTTTDVPYNPHHHSSTQSPLVKAKRSNIIGIAYDPTSPNQSQQNHQISVPLGTLLKVKNHHFSYC
jgi:hypothetical protein